jgi:integrase
VRYYEHGTRRTRNGQPDKYFAIRYYVNGKRKEEGVGWATEGWNAEKAHALLADIRAAIRTGKGPKSLAERREEEAQIRAAKEAKKQAEQRAEMTLEEFFRTVYIPRAKREKRSWLLDEQRIAKAVSPALGKLPLRAIRSEDVQKFVDDLSDAGNAPATVKQYMGIVRRAFNMAVETTVDGVRLFAGINPASGLRLPSVHNIRERYLLADEVEKLIAAAAKLRSPDLKDCIVLSLNTGLRMGELMRLRWLDVDMAGGFVVVPDETMRKPGGKVPLNKAASAVFEQRKHRQGQKDGERVFPPIAGALTRKNLSHMFRCIADEVGLNQGVSDPRHRIVFHSLRHTFASWLALAGTDIYRIKTLMRHKSISMTMRYAHLIPDATRDAVHNLRPPAPKLTKSPKNL